jgi:hypothetical protein
MRDHDALCTKASDCFGRSSVGSLPENGLPKNRRAGEPTDEVNRIYLSWMDGLIAINIASAG